MTAPQTSPHQLLDDGFAPPSCELLVVGCGNILRGDDAVGPRLIRHLWDYGVPDGVRLVDGGTAGMDVSFQMQGAKQVVIVDASSTGTAPGTVFRVPGADLEELPPASGLHTHSFRWDHALAFSRWLLGPRCPTEVTVFLIEAADLTPGEDLSPPVLDAMRDVARLLRREFLDRLSPPVAELTATGYLHLDACTANTYFPSDACGVVRASDQLLLMPLRNQANGGHVLKQRNSAGDRSLLIREVLADDLRTGTFRARWEQARGALVIDLDP